MIEYLNFRLDSLQRAYDSLLTDYQSIVEPVNATEEEIEAEEDPLFPIENTPDNIDSLLNIWYLQKSMTDLETDFESIERDTLTSNIPDSVYIARLQKMNSFIPLPFNRYVKNSIIRYTDKIPSITQNIISLSTYYLPQFEEIFDQYDLPKELKAMAVIESALNPTAVSRARARGMWQFMYTTAKRYGLQMTSFVDERYDPITSCHAAAAYLKDAYMIFGDWTLAIASYNCGAGNVSKAIRRAGGKTDFWQIYNYLPRETRGYIPAFVAALYVLQYYPEHNIAPKPISLPAHVDTFHVNKMLHFQQISDNIGIPVQTLREVNPQYVHDIIPGTEKTYILRIPHNYSMQFVDKEDQIYAYKDSVFFNTITINKIKETGGSDGQRIIHKVRKGETLGHIAMKYHTSVANLKRWNGLRGNTIRVGQRLSIYGSGSTVATKSSTATQTAPSTTTTVASTAPSTSSTANYTIYTVKKNDTLWGIASQFTGVSLNDILQLNGFTKKTKIYPGMKIRIKKAE
ncbi:MAG: LysM peptidoglycan-binding domain-containing protein [Bacteroidales bacterium]|nr:LysM peptidoglycan-binding domain-containing protein [Bacteroidales bacterium]MDD4669650.1 LysM peptidoglycan-binding domain-containing protein [Bacteroidales bacterium]